MNPANIAAESEGPVNGRQRFDGRATVRAFVELLAMTGLAIAQPLLDVFGRAPEAFTARDAGRGDLITFALLVTLVPPLVLTALVVLARVVDPPAAVLLHRGFVAALGALFVLQLVKELAGWGGVALVVAAALAFALLVVAQRRPAFHTAMAVLALAPVLFVGAFLTSSPASDVLRSSSVGAVELDRTGAARSVVMVVFDEWPQNSIFGADGEIDADLYPNLAALAADGAWYRNATTVATATVAAVPALLTGRYAVDGASPTAADHPENLFTLLASQYDLEVSESVTSLCPSSLCSGPFVDDPDASADAAAAADAEATRTSSSPIGDLVDDALHSYQAMISLDPDASGPQSIEEATSTVTATPTATTVDPQGTADAVDEARNAETANAGFPVLQIDAFQGLVDSIEADEEPAVHFLHLQLPHTPYRFLPDGRAYEAGGFGPGGDLLGARGPEQAEADADRHRLLLQVGYLDRLVGQLVDRLQETGLYDQTAVVVTSDHGAAFVPGQSHRGLEGEVLDRSLYPDILYVPLIVKAPQIEPGTVSDDNVASIDVLPTIADVLGLSVPWEVDGRSLLGPARTDPEKQFNKVDMGAGGFGGFGGAVELSERVRYDGDEVLAENLARNIGTLLREDVPGHEFYARTVDGDLVGTPVDALPAAPDADGRLLTDDGLDALRTYRTDDELVPTHLTGRIEGGTPGGHRLVVAIDGVIAAVAPTFVDGEGAQQVDLLLDPTELSGSPPHRIEAYLLTGQGERRRLGSLQAS